MFFEISQVMWINRTICDSKLSPQPNTHQSHLSSHPTEVKLGKGDIFGGGGGGFSPNTGQWGIILLYE